jgi:hypothetical protein
MQGTLNFIWRYRLWAFFVSLVGVGAMIVPLLFKFYYRWRDEPVWDFLDRKLPGEYIEYPGGWEYYPCSIKDIAGALGRSEDSVRASLLRLKKAYRVIESRYGWYTKANAPHE